MEDNKFIKNLVSDLKPVQVFKLEMSHYLKVLGVGAFSLLAGLALSGLRGDLAIIIRTPQFIIETILIIALAISSAVAALRLSVPGSSTKPTFITVGIAAGAWLLTLIVILVTDRNFIASRGLTCSTQVILGGVLPAVLIFKIASRGAPLKRQLIGWIAVLSGGAFGALNAHLSCSLSDPLHVLFWHLTPVLIVSALGVFIGKHFLRKL